MKYIKTFENNNEFKKYIILKILDDNKNIVLIICEIIEFHDDYRYRCSITKLYRIDEDGFRKISTETFKISDKMLKKHIVKQSDNLEELINMLDPMYQGEKFNI